MLKAAASNKVQPTPKTATFTGGGDPDHDWKNLTAGVTRGRHVPTKVATTRTSKLLGVVGWHTSPGRRFGHRNCPSPTVRSADNSPQIGQIICAIPAVTTSQNLHRRIRHRIERAVSSTGG